jgi:hypothetical protein
MHNAVYEPSRSARGDERRGSAPARDARPRSCSPPRRGSRSRAPAGRAATRRLRVRWRRVAVLALLVIAGVALLAGLRGPAGAAQQQEPGPLIVVGEGDTVWELVGPHVPAGVDRGVYAAEVVATNDLDPRHIAPGTVVRLP